MAIHNKVTEGGQNKRDFTGVQEPYPDGMSREKGFTLIEVMVAVLMLAMVSSMIYSILNVSIRFAEKGDKSILLLEREQGLIGILQRQIKNGWYDEQKKAVDIAADDTMLRITTRAPLLYPLAGVVIAVYRYDLESATLYYLEKRDFYNIDYGDDYLPAYEDMQVLVEDCLPLSFSYTDNSSSVTVLYDGKEFNFTPWCQVETRTDAI
ncbi:MAG: prepilin-type N-terminal cleavage/methylation domain-containing protein [Proteobacteria bacterium]|nr:prepilin-type N-terminal cleavage/methylation domain-containing protein [Pseudomonadota bacterium]MBU4298008.1 prepilin-type N-terminal cleavage/methylation domain-containing protein [Pseudomonadota bacterium]MCG2749568.1 prepilin-type N-terminal cleavage/methylation domain-containing protein [Desulfobulbaceae bacterium]